MKSSETDFEFPVLGFTPDLENWGFPTREALTRCGPRTLKERTQDGMELIDARCRSWRVVAVHRTGRAGSVLSLLPLFGPPQSRIEHDLQELPPVSLADVQQRMLASMQRYAADYASGGDDTEYRSLLQKVGQTRSIAEIYDLLQPDTFEPY